MSSADWLQSGPWSGRSRARVRLVRTHEEANVAGAGGEGGRAADHRPHQRCSLGPAPPLLLAFSNTIQGGEGRGYVENVENGENYPKKSIEIDQNGIQVIQNIMVIMVSRGSKNICKKRECKKKVALFVSHSGSWELAGLLLCI